MLLHSISDNDKFHKDVTKYIFALESELKKLEFFKAAQSKKHLTALESGQFFSDCVGAMEKIFAPNITAYTAMRWKYYLRRTPNAFFSGDLHSTTANSRALAEVYAQRSEAAGRDRQRPCVAFRRRGSGTDRQHAVG